MQIEAILFVNWIFWAALSAGTLLVVGVTERLGGTTRGYRLFMAWLLVAFAAVLVLSDLALPAGVEAAGDGRAAAAADAWPSRPARSPTSSRRSLAGRGAASRSRSGLVGHRGAGRAGRGRWHATAPRSSPGSWSSPRSRSVR